jgi:hypothetical protein
MYVLILKLCMHNHIMSFSLYKIAHIYLLLRTFTRI